jgi:twitching motility protein PilT
MHVDQLLELLKRSDVKEIALQSDRPPCVLIGDQYTPIINKTINEEQIMLLLGHTGGRVELLGLMDGPRKWEFQHAVFGLIGVSAAYHGKVLQVRFRLKAPPPAAKAPVTASKSNLGRPPPAPTGRGGSPFDFDGHMANQPPPAHGLDFNNQAAPAFEIDSSSLAELANPAGGRRPATVAEGIDLDDDLLEPPQLDFDDEEPAEVLSDTAIEHVTDAPPWPSSEEITVLEGLLRAARQKRATDIHVIAGRPPLFRLAGDLVEAGPVLDPRVVERMLTPLIPTRLQEDIDKHGSCDYTLVHPRLGRFRANVSRMRTGMKLAARPIAHRVPTLVELGLPDSIVSATHHHQGLIVVTGPTGHGKTTTLAAIVDIINRERTHHVITVEDPIEYVHVSDKAMISQREVGTHTGSFFTALKGSLREDPDVIVVGELRDTDTVRMALSASETGHLVISTMNTPSASKAIERIIDLFPPGDQPQVRMTLAGGLRLVISQRLVPTMDRKGLCCAAELLPGTPPLWALIRDNKTFQIPSLQQRGKALGIVRLDDSLAQLVRDEKTSAMQAKQFAENPEQFEALVQNRSPRGEAAVTLDSIDPTAQAAQRGIQMGKDMMSKAGRLFGDKK